MKVGLIAIINLLAYIFILIGVICFIAIYVYAKSTPAIPPASMHPVLIAWG
jgi:hypothetical protein